MAYVCDCKRKYAFNERTKKIEAVSPQKQPRPLIRTREEPILYFLYSFLYTGNVSTGKISAGLTQLNSPGTSVT